MRAMTLRCQVLFNVADEDEESRSLRNHLVRRSACQPNRRLANPRCANVCRRPADTAATICDNCSVNSAISSLRSTTERRRFVTNINAPHNCDRCGGKLVPPELLPTEPVGNRDRGDQPDYVCCQCLQKYCWTGNPPHLIAVP
jgi:hypothetical protein